MHLLDLFDLGKTTKDNCRRHLFSCHVNHVEIREPNGSKIQIKIIATVAKNLFFTKNFSALGRNIHFSTKCFNFHVRQHMAP